MKYLVVKGWLGFGDRLETLKMAIYYCKQNNLKIYVDWSDSLWSHGTENFYTYFKLINIPQIASLDEIPADATYYPAYWADHIKEPLTKELIDKQAEHKLNIGVLRGTYPADVVVLSSIGDRTLYNDSTLFADIFRVSDERVLQKVRDRRQRYGLSSALGIHIRGSDRFGNHKRDLSIQWLASSVAMSGGLNSQKIVVVSDDKASVDVWKRFYPQSIVLSELSIQQSSNEGNHNVSKDKLKFSKDEMNVDTLVDFFTLASTFRIHSTSSDSRFTKEAKRLKPFVQRILS